ncbi:MAG: hypothetical protein ACI9M6_000785 [Hydrogenophaga sp.]
MRSSGLDTGVFAEVKVESVQEGALQSTAIVNFGL